MAFRLALAMAEPELQFVTTDTRWYQLATATPPYRIDPKTYVMPVPGGMLFRVALPASPMVFVPNLALSDLVGAPD